MISREQATPITGFKGLDKSLPVPRPGYTRSLLNVKVRNNQVTGRGGVAFSSTFSGAMSESALQLMPYIASSTLATTLLRIGPTKVEKSTGGAWTDITGTALNGAAGDKPQWANFRGTLYFTNEGKDDTRSWAGSGNTAEIASGTSPLCKGIMSYYGFLFLLHIYDSSAAAFAPRRAMYSQTPDTDWTQCAANLLNFNETPGALLAGIPWGEVALMMKEDGVVVLQWVGGQVKFKQRLMKGAPGTLAPLAAQACADKGVIYLGKDYELYIADSNGFEPLSPNVNDILQNDLYKASVANCRSVVVESEETYSLFFPRDSGGNTGRIDFNYRTGEFAYSTYPSHAIAAAQTVRWTKTAEESVIGQVATKAYTFDDDTSKVDNITASSTQTVSRYYDTDWLSNSNSAAQFTGATLVFDADAYLKCAVSVAVDHQNTFRFRKVYNLRPKKPGDEYVSVRFDVPPINVEWVNLRIEFLPNTTGNPTLRSGALHFVPQQEKRDVRRSAALSEE